ncbi:MAG: TolC family protein, partial [Myxococcota bacterium]
LLALLPAVAFAEPLDLAACVRRALAQNPAVQDAQDSATSATLVREVALADYNLKAVPSVDGGLMGSNETNQRYEMLFSRKLLATGTEVLLTGGTRVFSSVPQVSIPYLTETRVGISQPLFQGRSRLENRERIDDAERRIAASEHALASAREDLALQVVRGFYDVVGASELVGVAGKSLERVEELGEIARAKLSLGSVSKMDVFRTDLHAARIRNAVVQQTARVDAGLDALKMLLGIDPRVKLEIDARLQGPSAVDLAGEDLVEKALERRHEVVEAREQVTDTERKLLLARQRLWPAVSLAGFYARQGLGDTFDDSLVLDRDEWTIGLRSTVPLDRTAERVALAEAELDLRGKERQYRRVRDEVVREVRQAQRQLERAHAELALAAEIADHAEQQAELARFRYEKGITNNFDLVQAEEQRTEAKSAYVLAAIEETLSAALVRRAAGALEDAFGGSGGARAE